LNGEETPPYLCGGVIYCNFGASPFIEKCDIVANNCVGIYLYVAGWPIFSNCEIDGNVLGIDCYYSYPTIKNCIIHGCEHGGIALDCSQGVTIYNSVIADNSADIGGGILVSHSIVEIKNVVLWGNEANLGSQIYIEWYFGLPSIVNIEYSDDDPMFSVGSLSRYHLGLGSPCIDAGNPDPQYNDPEDPLNPGYALWPALGTVRNDMGVYGGQGAGSWVGIIDDKQHSNSYPFNFFLFKNFPNPFNPITTISYQLSAFSQISLAIFDLQGRLVTQLISGYREAGLHEVIWNAEGLPSGVYFVRLEADGFASTQKALLMR
jgi:parallel beta-helix repeat protein